MLVALIDICIDLIGPVKGGQIAFFYFAPQRIYILLEQHLQDTLIKKLHKLT